MNLPPFVFARAFWEGVSFLLAGVLALLAYFGYVDPSWAVPASVILTVILGVLRMFGIQPELQFKVAMEELKALKARLYQLQPSVTPKSKK